MSVLDNVDYILNGENIDADVLNRPIKQIGEKVDLAIQNAGIDVNYIRTPVITSPTSSEPVAAGSVTINAGQFAPIYSADQRDYREFQVILFGEDWSTAQITQINSDTLDFSADPSTTYEVRVKDVATNGAESEWSSVVDFTTSDAYVVDPSLTVEGSPSEVPEEPTLTGSGFQAIGTSDTHNATDWEVRKASDNSLVWSSIGDTANLTSIQVPAGNLVEGTSYIFRMRYEGTLLGYSNWDSVTATTEDSFLPTMQSYDAITDTGFIGTVSAYDFITGYDLASQIGLSAGTSQNSSSDWLVFYVGENAPCNRTSPKYAYKLYVSMKTFRNNLSWDDINAVNAMYGYINVTVGGETYECRLLTGAEADPTVDENGIGSEWNDLIYRVHQDVPTEQVGDNWANYTDCDLLVDYICGDGSYSWCQETSSGDTSLRVARGYNGVTRFYAIAASFSHSGFGWRPGLAIPV